MATVDAGTIHFTGVGSLGAPASSPAYKQLTSLNYAPAASSLILLGHSVTEQAECQVGNGTNVPAGTSNYGFTDTTYNVTQAQILATVTTSVL